MGTLRKAWAMAGVAGLLSCVATCSFSGGGVSVVDGSAKVDRRPPPPRKEGGPPPDLFGRCTNPALPDTDCDGVVDLCDDCPGVPDPAQQKDSSGNPAACTAGDDPDADGLLDADDPWPLQANAKLFVDPFDGTEPFGATWSTSGAGSWAEDTTKKLLAQTRYSPPGEAFATVSPALLGASGAFADGYVEARLARTQGPPDGSSAAVVFRYGTAGYYACELTFGSSSALSLVQVTTAGGAPRATVLAAQTLPSALTDGTAYPLRAFAEQQFLACTLHREGSATADGGIVNDPLVSVTLPAAEAGVPASGTVGLRTEQAAVQISSFLVYALPACPTRDAGPRCAGLPVTATLCGP